MPVVRLCIGSLKWLFFSGQTTKAHVTHNMAMKMLCGPCEDHDILSALLLAENAFQAWAWDHRNSVSPLSCSATISASLLGRLMQGLRCKHQSERGTHSSGRGVRGVDVRSLCGVGSPWSHGHHSAESRRALCSVAVQFQRGNVLGATSGKEGSQRRSGIDPNCHCIGGGSKITELLSPIFIDSSFNYYIRNKNYVRF